MPGDRCPVRRISGRSCLRLYHDSDRGGSPISDLPERISTVACVLSAVIHGIIGSFIGWKKKENRQYSNTFLLGVTFISEMIHIVLILLLTRPFDAAVEIVKIVIVPMVIINSVGMVIFFNVFKSIFNTEDLKVASKVSLAMRTAERCTPYLGSVEKDRKTAGKIIDIIMEEYHCQGAALINDMKFLARSGAFSSIVLTENNYPRLLSATKTFKTTRISRVPLPEDGFYPLYKENVIISAPILLDEGKVLALVMLVKKNAYPIGRILNLSRDWRITSRCRSSSRRWRNRRKS